jgi:hypothetical protein
MPAPAVCRRFETGGRLYFAPAFLLELISKP